MNVLTQSVRGYVLALVFASGALVLVTLLTPVARAQAPAAAPSSARAKPSPASALLKQARDAEAAYQFDVALDRLYTLQLEQPRTPDALAGRLLLARLLMLVGDLPAAILQAQALSDELPANRSERAQALDLATAGGRRLRSIPIQYKNPEIAATKGLVEFKDPTAIVPDKDGSFVIVDQGAKRLFRLADDTVAPLAVAQPEPSAVASLPDGTLVIAVNPDKNKEKIGAVASAAGKPIPTTGTWDGRMRPLKKVSAMAVNSAGDVFIVDGDYTKGLLRCKAGATNCEPWGPPGELTTVKVGASDFVYLLDVKLQTVRVVDNSGKQMAAIGPLVAADPAAFAQGAANVVSVNYEFKRIVDIAIDQTYTLYLLDASLRKIGIVPLRLVGNQLVAEVKGTVDISADDRTPFGMKSPSAMAVTPSGALIVAGGSTSRLVRFR